MIPNQSHKLLPVEQRHRDLLREIDNAYAAYMGDPEGKDDCHTAREAAAEVIARFERDTLASKPTTIRDEVVEAIEQCAQIVDQMRGNIQKLFADRFHSDEGHVENGDCLAYGDLICESLAVYIRALASHDSGSVQGGEPWRDAPSDGEPALWMECELRDGRTIIDRAFDLEWGSIPGEPESEIVRYRLHKEGDRA